MEVQNGHYGFWEFYRKIRGRAMIETTVLGGFPVLAVARINSAEPDVGYDSIWVDDTDLELFTLRGKPAPLHRKENDQRRLGICGRSPA